MKIEFEKLLAIVNTTSYKNGGASTEVMYGHYLEKDFPNSELYWKKFIVPTTNRLYGNNHLEKLNTDNREGISADLLDIGSFHYTIFSHLFQAENNLIFENFYVRLGSICDLVEEFLLLVYLIKLCCTGQQSKIWERLTKDEFLEIAGNWYDKNYLTLYDLYLKKGKHIPIEIPRRNNILKEYYSDDSSWRKYSLFSQGIKTYRNKIIHYYILARLHDQYGNWYIPKKEKVNKYRRWADLQKAISGITLIPEDFIEENTQMIGDLDEMKRVLQVLWEKPINDMNELLYVQKNELLLKKYNLEF